jgi:Antitoxin Xre-like helix-turn-helix domain
MSTAQEATAPPLASGELQTFWREGDRARLSAVGLKAYLSLAKRWGLSNAEAAMLLGVSASSWDRIKRGRRPVLSQDQLTRVSALIGIFKGLHLLFADSMADRWPRLRNKGPLFEQETPIQAMMEGGIPRMIEVRRYVDAVRGGM